MTKVSDRGYRFLRDDEITHGLQRVDVAGGGCLLVKMRVFDRLTQPYFAPEFEYGTDVQLCRQAAEKGFEVWADTSIELGHLKPTRTIVTTRNRHQFQLNDQLPGEVKRTFVSTAVYDDLIRDAAAWTGYRDLAEMTAYAQTFHDHWETHKAAGGSDVDWYRLFPKERVARQVWFNTTATHKRQMTDFILNAVNHATPLSILDFGCGIGIPAYVFAQKGHDVMAMDIAGTGTFEFLRWRVKQAGLSMTFAESRGGVPALSSHRFDIIVAMDCLEHIPEWRRTLTELVAHLKPGGALFCNNAILDDPHHAEHYDLRPKDFQIAAAEEHLIASNQILYLKRADVPEPVHA
jgi:2-polyprenyl-3-methyl-5-hydroxy-6-metoxy-1,4-benzoquinol methylase